MSNINSIKKLSFILLVFLSINCQKASNHFFDFDEIVHYHVSNKFENSLKKNRSKLSSDEKKFLEIFQQQAKPKTLYEKDFIGDVEKFYSQKNLVDKKFYQEISNIFSEKSQSIIEEKACDPFFRDILIFKKNGTITGISKICFQCDQIVIVSTKKNTQGFGQNIN